MEEINNNEEFEAGEKSFQPQSFSYEEIRRNNPSLSKISKREFINRPNLQKEVLGRRIDGKEDYNPVEEFENVFEDDLMIEDYLPTGRQEEIYLNSNSNQFAEGGYTDTDPKLEKNKNKIKRINEKFKSKEDFEMILESSKFKPKNKAYYSEIIRKDNLGRVINSDGEMVYKNEKGIYVPYPKREQPQLTTEKKTKSEVIESNKKSTEKREHEEFVESVKEKVIKPIDVLSDIAQIGNFIPHPIAQEVGKVGNVVGTMVDSYQAVDDAKEGNYDSALINLGSAVLPSALGSNTFRRSSKFSSLAPELNKVFGSYGPTRYLNIANRVRKQSPGQLASNRALLGVLGLETSLDAELFKSNYNEEIESGGENNELVRFDNGGTHEENKYGGIPIGTDSRGKMNTVEEGETRYKFNEGDYVFSNRVNLDGTGLSSSKPNTFQNGGYQVKETDPIGNLSQEQSKDIESQRNWLNDWNKRRVVEGVKLNDMPEVPFSTDIYVDDLNYGRTGSRVYGEFDTVSNRVLFDENYRDKEGIPSHEFSHRFQKDFKLGDKENYNKYIQSPILDELRGVENLSPYHADPQENHAEINRFRYNNNLDPEKSVTPEDMDKFDFSGYNLNHFKKEQLLNLLNKTADNSKMIDANYAAFGGYLKYKQESIYDIYNKRKRQ